MTSCDVAFVMEHSMGHATHADNLRAIIGDDGDVRPHFAFIPFEARGLAARMPIVSGNWTVRGGLLARRALVRLSRRSRLDGLFIHTQVPAVLCTDWLRRLPGFVSLDATPLQFDALGKYYDHTVGPAWVEAIKWRLNRRCYAAARHLIAWSAWTKQSLVADYGIADDKVTVIPPGVDIAGWRRPPSPDRPPGRPVRILFVGGDLERKGGRLLLEAFRVLRAPDVELHVVTHDALPEEPGLRVYRDIGPNDARLKRLYHGSDIFALPTQGDCLPLALAEAGAAGLATVTTAVGAIPEIVRDNETGLIVPVGDGQALTEALRALIRAPALRQRLAAGAAAHVARAHDAVKNARRLVTLIGERIRSAEARGEPPA